MDLAEQEAGRVKYVGDDDEVELQWAAIERLPTIKRLKTSLLDDDYSTDKKEKSTNKRLIDVTKLGVLERHIFIEKLISNVEDDNFRLLQKLRGRMDKVHMKLPTVEVRYKNLTVEAKCDVVHGKPLPTLWNSFKSMLSVLTKITGCNSQKVKISILKDVSGIIKPSRMTLLLGPPGCGKTTFLMALAGTLNNSTKIRGEISYNGYRLDEFVPQKTSSYISQYNLHISEMTVRETLDFSASCQGVGNRAATMREVMKREKGAGIIPESDIDTYMKAISINGLRNTLQTDYILKILGLEICADIMAGDAMKRGISGGQKKRLTTGEMIIGPTNTLFMDNISSGLDSSTTFQIISCLQQFVHIMESTMVISLLQPAPEVFDLFDDIILMAEGRIVYHGPRSHALELFEGCGFKCPERKGVADFLQEVISKKDQAQYWISPDVPYSYVSVNEFVNIFKKGTIGQKLDGELLEPYDKTMFPKEALSFSTFSLGKWDLFKTCMSREWLLMRRNSFVHLFKSSQLIVTALMTMTIFIRTEMKLDLVHANYYMGSLFYALIRVAYVGFSELSLTVSRLPVFYKQRDLYFYPAWAYAIAATIIKIPFSLVESFLWTCLTYYVIGYAPEIERFFGQFFILLALHLASTSMFRMIASLTQNHVTAIATGTMSLLILYLFGGFILSRPTLPAWLAWGFWLSPVTYAEIGVSINEFHAPRWQKVLSANATLGQQVLVNRGLNFDDSFYWLSIGALVGFWMLFNVGVTLALTYLKSPETTQVIISHENIARPEVILDLDKIHPNTTSSPAITASSAQNGNMLLPFEPIAVTFQSLQYFIDTPVEMQKQGFPHKRLQLLHDITGAFRPGVLTALMGVSGAGKTTLMDVLSGRKTTGIIEGQIMIGGYPKVQKTYARISGYCEQTDIHSPQLTIEESVIFSAFLRLPPQIDSKTKSEFVKQVLEKIELDEIKDALVGIPGVSGVSDEQRKRLTIAVELVSNPSIIFMDEPTSGLDARAAAIVMRVVKNIVGTGRTVVCTIHQPSIDIFEAFDEMILMKRGGEMIYSGPLGDHSSKLIQYFEPLVHEIRNSIRPGFDPKLLSIPGIPKITDNYNPATWMLEVTAPSSEAQLGVNLSELYKESPSCWDNNELVKELSIPPSGSRDLHFATPFPQNGWVQFKSCLWKQHLSYWRSPKYNFVRLIFLTIASSLFGILLWQKGTDINNEQDLISILGSIFIVFQFVGGSNCTSVIPYIMAERIVMYRENFAGMYSPWAYSFAQVAIEIPYNFLQAVLFVTITYPAIGYYWSVYKVFWYSYATLCTFLYFNYLGMLIASLTATVQIASVSASFCYTLMNLFSGFLVPEPQIPKWWVWAYWISPSTWSLKGQITSQYGDITKEIMAFGAHKSVRSFLEDYLGYHHDQLGVTAIILFAFPLVFATLFAYFIGKVKFQRR